MTFGQEPSEPALHTFWGGQDRLPLLEFEYAKPLKTNIHFLG